MTGIELPKLHRTRCSITAKSNVVGQGRRRPLREAILGVAARMSYPADQAESPPGHTGAAAASVCQ